MKFKDIRGYVITPGIVFIFARQATNGKDVMIASYDKTEGLIELYKLKSVLDKSQKKQIGDLIDEFDPAGAFKREEL